MQKHIKHASYRQHGQHALLVLPTKAATGNMYLQKASIKLNLANELEFVAHLMFLLQPSTLSLVVSVPSMQRWQNEFSSLHRVHKTRHREHEG